MFKGITGGRKNFQCELIWAPGRPLFIYNWFEVVAFIGPTHFKPTTGK